jgi:plastocyanin
MDRDTRGIRFVVVQMSSTGSALSNSLSAVAQYSQRKLQARMDQQDYAFVPRVLVVREGEPVIFTNSDPANHNVRTASPIHTNEFNVYVGTDGKYEHRFGAQKTPIRLGCDIHPWMQGWIYVFQHPHFAVTDAKGRLHMDSLPPGEYKLVFHQPDIRYNSEETITVSDGKPTRFELEIRDDHLLRPKE